MSSRKKVQHRSPCAMCPFSRKTQPGYLGGSPPLVYIGQANGNFRLPCHTTHKHQKLKARLNRNNIQCAGAAIFRSNVGVADRINHILLHLPADTDKVFATFAEFLAYHAQITVGEAEAFLRQMPPNKLTQIESARAMPIVGAGNATLDLVPKKS